MRISYWSSDVCSSDLWPHESSFRLEVYLFVLLAPLAWWLGDSGVERALMIGSMLLVLAVELLNSAIEAVIERYGPEHHELAGRAKDMGSENGRAAGRERGWQ